MCITFFTKKKFQTISLIPYFLQNIKAHGSQIFKRLSSNMITHSSIYPKCFNTWIIYFFKIKSSNMLTHTIYCPKCISTSITYFQKKIIKHVQTQIYFSKMYQHMQHILFTNNSSNIINHTWFLQNVEAHGSQFSIFIRMTFTH